jgi:Fe2+ or Zn2+ uptake regulation protein
MKHYYQTTPLDGNTLQEMIESNERQETRILNFLREKKINFTAWDLLNHFPKIPISSIRRSLHNLREQGYIIEVGYSDGIYNKPVTVFKAKPGQLEIIF